MTTQRRKNQTRRSATSAPTSRRASVAGMGIDLGTTRTVVSLADRGNYPVLPFTDPAGDSYEYFPSLTALVDGGLVHGFAAREAARQGAPLLRGLKRSLALPTATWSTPIELGDRAWPLGELLTSFLTSLRKAIASGLRSTGPVSALPVAIAVPAHAYAAQRLITLDAFRSAGFSVRTVLNEPSAAGLEYTHRQRSTLTSRRTRVLVYDLGSGTFDTSLVDTAGGRHEVLGSRGLPDLGGDDVDLLMAQMVLERAGLEESELSSTEVNDLLDQCRAAKEALSPQSRRVVIELRGSTVTLRTDELYEACLPLLDRSLSTMAPLVGHLEDQAPDLKEVAGIYLVGGGSCLPIVPRVLRERFGRRVHRSPYPGASTAIGLAIAIDPEARVSLIDRLSRALGVFREADEGQRAVLDVVLSPEAVAERGVGSHLEDADGQAAEATVVTREYTAVHNAVHLRFVECAGTDEAGSPRGVLAPLGHLILPLDPALRGVDHLGPDSVVRTGPGPRVHERYEVDSSGLVRLTITNLADGDSRTLVLGRQGVLPPES